MADTTANTEKEHDGLIVDSDQYFQIDAVTREITSDSKKISLMQYDHNSERFTFTVDKLIEGHDMTNCTIRIHYCNVNSSTRAKYNGLYEVRDAVIDPENENKIKFTWLISQNATQYPGVLGFLIEFTCVKTQENGEVEVYYRWNTNINKNIAITAGMNNNDIVDERYVDLITEWEAMIKAHLSDCDERLEDGIQEIIGYVPTGENAVNLKTVTDLNTGKKIYIWIGTKEEYDALTTLDEENIWYVIKDFSIEPLLDDIVANIESISDRVGSLETIITEQRLDVAEGRIDATETRLDDIEKTHVRVENLETVTVNDHFPLDSSFIGSTIDTSLIEIDTSVVPHVPDDSNNFYFIEFWNGQEPANENDNTVSIIWEGGCIGITTRPYDDQGSGINVWGNGNWSDVALETIKDVISNYPILSYYNTTFEGDWNNWLLYRKNKDIKAGDLQSPDDNNFYPKTDISQVLRKDSVRIQTVYKEFISGEPASDGLITLLTSSELPPDKTFDDVFAISFKSSDGASNYNRYFSAIKSYGDIFHFTIPFAAQGSGQLSQLEFYNVNLRLLNTGESLKAWPHSSLHTIAFGTEITATSHVWNSIDEGIGMWDVLIYFK